MTIDQDKLRDALDTASCRSHRGNVMPKPVSPQLVHLYELNSRPKSRSAVVPLGENDQPPGQTPRRHTPTRNIMSTAIIIVFAIMCLTAGALLANAAWGRDMTGLTAQLSPSQREWVRNLTDNDGSGCCDDADGIDPVWRMSESSESGYEVMVDGKWLEVEKRALITKPNKIGVARAWKGRRWNEQTQKSETFIRCFVPGAGG